MGSGESIGWGIYNVGGAGFDSSDRIKFGIDDGYKLGSSGGLFYGLNYGHL